MSQETIGLLHPGEMGAALGAALIATDNRVLWASQGRSPATQHRAATSYLVDVGSLEALTQQSSVILSVCPPDQATAVAQSIANLAYQGLYIDANAIAPSTAELVRAAVERGGARFVDGGIIGGPPAPGGATRLYLSGPEAMTANSLFDGSDRLESLVIDDSFTAASALKMCYASWTKVSSALLLAVWGAANEMGVEKELAQEFLHSQPALAARTQGALRSAPKAWRFTGEMHEISRAYTDAGARGSTFADAATKVYEAISTFKGASTPTLKEVLSHLNTVKPAAGPSDDSPSTH